VKRNMRTAPVARERDGIRWNRSAGAEQDGDDESALH
jgi:hypothetical protein